MLVSQIGSSGVEAHTQGPPESLYTGKHGGKYTESISLRYIRSKADATLLQLTKTDELTAMMYNMAAPITLPARSSVVNLLPFLAKG